MKLCGIIIEYNPLHNGHLYHIEETKRLSQCDALIAVMSGDFVERGEPAILSKYVRTELALKAGIDLVIELPYLYSVAHAELFAYGAIKLLAECGVDEIYFGSESDDEHTLTELATLLDTPLFSTTLKRFLSEGYSYPKAASLTFNQLIPNHQEVSSNDQLAIQYIRHLLKISPNIKYHTIKRLHNAYQDEVLSDDLYSSATSIRQAIFKGIPIDPYVPAFTLQTFKEHTPLSWDSFYPLLVYQILVNHLHLNQIHDVTEGIEEAIYTKAQTCQSISELTDQLTSKRYTKARIQRILTHILNNITKDEVKAHPIENGPYYIRILGVHKRASEIIKKIKKHSDLPLITNITKANYPLIALDERTSLVYHLYSSSPLRRIPIMIE